MNKTKIIIFSMLLMGLALFVNMDDVSADSSVIYVNATGGNDGYDGQNAFWNGTSGPKASIKSGATAVTANGTVNIADGIYNGSNNRDIILNKNMVIKGQSTDGTIIDGSSTSRIFVINSGVNISLLNITIRNTQSNTNGGAIQNNGGTLTVNNSKFTGNRATRDDRTNIYGGAIYSTGTLNIINSTFSNNLVQSGRNNDAQGGAIYSSGPLTITDSIFTNNTATSSAGTQNDDGGAIAAFGTLKITRSTFTNNRAGNVYGGGALMIGDNTRSVANVEITESTFTNNTAGFGGAIWINGGTANNPALITKSIFTGNSATEGGAIRNWGFLNVIGSDFTGNSATQGAAINNNQGTANINFNRIIGNTGSVEIYRNLGTVNAINNWWGSNTSPSAKVSSQVNVSTWLVLNIISSPNSIYTGNTSTITADITRNQNGVYFNPANGHVPDGIVVNFTGTLGSITSGTLVNGSVSRTFTAGYTPGVAVVNATVDTVRVNTSVNINPAASITITQSVNTPVNVGNKVTFLVNVKNNGPNTATNINIRDIIPNGLSGVIVTPSVGTYNATTGIWTIPSLTNGSTATLNITGNATIPMAGKTTENIATQINQTEYTPELAHSTIGVYTKMADVVMSQTSTKIVNVGDVVTYIVSIINIGPDAATNFIIEDIIPADLLNVVVTPSTGTYVNGNWTVPFLANGDSATLTITAVASAAMAGKNTTNTATKIFETEYDPTTIGESVSSDAYTKEAGLVVTNTANGDRLNAGEPGIFTVVVTNNGPDEATNIKITNDALPDAFTASWDIGDYANNIWTISSLASGESATITFTCDGLYDSYAGTTITNHIKVDLTEYPFTVNVDDSSIYVKMANVVINQTGSYNKNNVTFIVNVKNNGPDNATNILIENTIPEGLTNVVFTPSIGTYDSETGIWTIPLLTNGQVATLNVTGTAVPQSTIYNWVSIISQDEYSYEDKDSTYGVYVPVVDLLVRNYEWYPNRGNVYSFGEAAPYVSYVMNFGPDDATNIVVKYTIGSGFIYQGYSVILDGVDNVVFDGQNLTYYINYLPKNGIAAILIYLQVNTTGNKTDDLTTTASLVSVDQNENGTYMNSETKKLAVANAADIQVTQTVNGKSSIQTQTQNEIELTILVTNNGPNTCNNIIIDETLSGLTYVSNDGNCTYDNNTGKVIWNINSLESGETTILNIIVKADSVGLYKPIATKTGPGVPYDWNFANNAETIYVFASSQSSQPGT